VAELWDRLGHLLLELFATLGQLLAALGAAFPLWPLLIVWVAWWLLAVNWERAWPVLARGGWAPVVLLIVITALAWSRLAPADLPLAPAAVVPNFWWQLVAVSLLAASALFCGWLQGVFNWGPPEIDLEPPAAPAGGHGHGHHH
jgi:hypothetical protein